MRATLPIFTLLSTLLSARGSDSPIPVKLDEFFGSTADAVMEVVKQDLQRSGRILLTDENPQWTVTGSSSGGRVKGVLMDAKGEVVLTIQYGMDDPSTEYVEVKDLRTNAHEFSDDVIEMITGQPGIASRQIAFIRESGGRRSLCTVDTSGKNLRVIPTGRLPVSSPAFSPGNEQLAFSLTNDGQTDVWLTSLDDGAASAIILASGTNSGASISPDGTRLALTMSHEGNPDIYISLIAGTHSKRLTKSSSIEFSPAWSPDSSQVVFCSDGSGSPQLYIMSRSGGEPQRLGTRWQTCTDPDWCPDGVRIAFTAHRGSTRSIAVYDLNRGTSAQIEAGGWDPSWAADGRHLVYVKSDGLHILDTMTGDSRKLVSGNVSEPTWSR